MRAVLLPGLLLAVTSVLFAANDEKASAGPAVLTVNNTANGGPMTLRHAIESANGNPGADIINFDPAVFPPGSPATINLTSALPDIDGEQGITIDGTGAGVIVDGSSAGNVGGFSVVGDAIMGVTFRGMTIQDFAREPINVFGQTINDLTLEDLVLTSTGLGADGANVFAPEGITNVAILGVTAESNDDNGVNVFSSGGVTGVTVRDSSISNNGGTGLNLGGSASLSGVSVTDSAFSSNEGTGLSFFSGGRLQTSKSRA